MAESSTELQIGLRNIQKTMFCQWESIFVQQSCGASTAADECDRGLHSYRLPTVNNDNTEKLHTNLHHTGKWVVDYLD